MSNRRLFLVDPFNLKHMEMIEDYEEENELSNEVSRNLGKIRASMTQADYQKKKKQTNELSESLFIERDGKIIDMCQIQGEKDIKTVRITLSSSKKREKKTLLSLATNYAIDSLGMEEVFIVIDPKDKAAIHYLDSLNYEQLGEENGKIIYLKDKEEIMNNRRLIA